MELSKSKCPQHGLGIWSHSMPKMEYPQHIVGISQCSECVVKSSIVSIIYKQHSVGDITCYTFIFTTFWPQQIDNGPQTYKN